MARDTTPDTIMAFMTEESKISSLPSVQKSRMVNGLALLLARKVEYIETKSSTQNWMFDLWVWTQNTQDLWLTHSRVSYWSPSFTANSSLQIFGSQPYLMNISIVVDISLLVLRVMIIVTIVMMTKLSWQHILLASIILHIWTLISIWLIILFTLHITNNLKFCALERSMCKMKIPQIPLAG